MDSVAVLDQIFDRLREIIDFETAHRLADWQADEEIQQLLDDLGNKANEGTITPSERDKYETYVRVIDFIGILQAQARAVLQQRKVNR